jgi:hypothetical protein
VIDNEEGNAIRFELINSDAVNLKDCVARQEACSGCWALGNHALDEGGTVQTESDADVPVLHLLALPIDEQHLHICWRSTRCTAPVRPCSSTPLLDWLSVYDNGAVSLRERTNAPKREIRERVLERLEKLHIVDKSGTRCRAGSRRGRIRGWAGPGDRDAAGDHDLR